MKLTLFGSIMISGLALATCGPGNLGGQQDTVSQRHPEDGAQALAQCRATTCTTLVLNAASLED